MIIVVTHSYPFWYENSSCLWDGVWQVRVMGIWYIELYNAKYMHCSVSHNPRSHTELIRVSSIYHVLFLSLTFIKKIMGVCVSKTGSQKWAYKNAKIIVEAIHTLVLLTTVNDGVRSWWSIVIRGRLLYPNSPIRIRLCQQNRIKSHQWHFVITLKYLQVHSTLMFIEKTHLRSVDLFLFH